MKLNQSIHARSKSSLQRCLKMCGKKKNKWQLKRTILGYTEAELKSGPDFQSPKNPDADARFNKTAEGTFKE